MIVYISYKNLSNYIKIFMKKIIVFLIKQFKVAIS